MAADNFLWFPEPAKGGSAAQVRPAQPEGETTDTWFSKKKALEVLSFSFGVSQAETTGSGSTGAGAGKAKFEEFTHRKVRGSGQCAAVQRLHGGRALPQRDAGDSQGRRQQPALLAVHLPHGLRHQHQLERRRRRRSAQRDRQVQVRRDGHSVHPAEGGRNRRHQDPGLWSTTTNKPILDVAGLGAAPPFLLAIAGVSAILIREPSDGRCPPAYDPVQRDVMIGDNFMWIPRGLRREHRRRDHGHVLRQEEGIRSRRLQLHDGRTKSQLEGSGGRRGGARRGKAKFQEFTVDKLMDSASVPLATRRARWEP